MATGVEVRWAADGRPRGRHHKVGLEKYARSTCMHCIDELHLRELL